VVENEFTKSQKRKKKHTFEFVIKKYRLIERKEQVSEKKNVEAGWKAGFSIWLALTKVMIS